MESNNTTQQPKTFSPEADKALVKLERGMRNSNYKILNITKKVTKPGMYAVASEVFDIKIEPKRSRDLIKEEFEKIFQNNPDILSNALQLQRDKVLQKKTHRTNKGTGAGGSNTNKNGLSYEKITDLDDRIITIMENKTSSSKIEFNNCNKTFKIKFNNYDKTFIKTEKADFFKCMKHYENTSITRAHGCKHPDECYIDEDLKNIFIIEKKFQQCSGSVCEKTQAASFKRWHYSETFPDFNIVYIFCLSDWFKHNCIAELKYLSYQNIPYFWGSSKTYKDDIITFMINYK